MKNGKTYKNVKSGIIAIHKPEGISSAGVVARVKKHLQVKKVGHTGTLDPFATGLLLCTINNGTRISRFFLDGHKRYQASVTLGVETDTYDLTGKTTFTYPENIKSSFKNEDIEQVVNSFIGSQDQVPPAFSALKHEGRPLYELARQGKTILKPARQITIFDISIKAIDLPHVDIEVFSSKGTYIRSLAFDIGRKLGCGAHLSKLCRTGSSAFKLENAIELSEFETLDNAAAEQRIISLSDCLDFMPKVVADETIARKIGYGQKLLKGAFESFLFEPGEFIRVVDPANTLLAVIQLSENRQAYNYSCVFPS